MSGTCPSATRCRWCVFATYRVAVTCRRWPARRGLPSRSRAYGGRCGDCERALPRVCRRRLAIIVNVFGVGSRNETKDPARTPLVRDRSSRGCGRSRSRGRCGCRLRRGPGTLSGRGIGKNCTAAAMRCEQGGGGGAHPVPGPAAARPHTEVPALRDRLPKRTITGTGRGWSTPSEPLSGHDPAVASRLANPGAVGRLTPRGPPKSRHDDARDVVFDRSESLDTRIVAMSASNGPARWCRRRGFAHALPGADARLAERRDRVAPRVPGGVRRLPGAGLPGAPDPDRSSGAPGVGPSVAHVRASTARRPFGHR